MLPPNFPHSLKRLTQLVLLVAALAGSPSLRAGESRYEAPYPSRTSKKGLQVEIVEDALALGIQHATFNFDLGQLIDPAGNTNNPSWEFEGRRYYFHQPYVRSLDERIKAMSQHNVTVTLIVLTYQSGEPEVNRILIHPDCPPETPNRLGAFNTATEEGRRWLSATMEFCAERWSRPDRKYGRVAGYIMGNEVNSHWWWSNMGRVSMETFTDAYHQVLRLAHTAVRRQSSWARVYVSLEHHWNTRFGAGDDHQAFAGRPFLELFARKAREAGDFDWHVAFHPYPENLFEPRFWNDASATTNVLTTPRITFKNIELLPQYLQQPEMLYQGKPRRIILSEQGFHTPARPDGEAIQAAAYVLAYRKVAALEGIDSFILHRHVDHPREGGLLLGLRGYQPGAADPRPRKEIYECFRAIDTPHWRDACKTAEKVLGHERWEALK